VPDDLASANPKRQGRKPRQGPFLRRAAPEITPQDEVTTIDVPLPVDQRQCPYCKVPLETTNGEATTLDVRCARILDHREPKSHHSGYPMSQKTYQRYSNEFKDKAVALLGLGKPVSEVARDLQVSTLAALCLVAPGHPTANGERHFKKGRNSARHDNPQQRRTMIQDIHTATGHPIRTICRVLELPRGSYFSAAKPTLRQLTDAELTSLIVQLFRQHCDTLQQQGHSVSADRVRRLMREARLNEVCDFSGPEPTEIRRYIMSQKTPQVTLFTLFQMQQVTEEL
jgi:hypothetical protein